MHSLGPQGLAVVDELAERHAFSRDAIAHMVTALDHRIDGPAQQQGSHSRFTVNSQHGDVDLASLPVISTGRQPPS